MHAARLILAFLTYASAVTLNDLEYIPLINNTSYKKCCKWNQRLKVIQTNVVCTENNLTQNTHYVAESLKEYSEDCKNVECVDFLGSQLVKPDCESSNFSQIDIHSVFPKCCPLNYQYDPEEHKCVQVLRDKLSTMLKGVLKVGLENCEPEVMAIVDYSNLSSLQHGENNSIDIEGKRFSFGQFCFDTNFNKKERLVLRICQKAEDVCKVDGLDTKRIRCLKKCCPDGFMYKHGNKCKPTYDHGITLNTSKIANSTNSKFAIISATTKKKKYLAGEEHHFRIDVNGQLQVIENDLFGVYSYQEAFYCIETRQAIGKNASQAYFLFVKKPSVEDESKFYISAILLTISCIFLFLTLIVYMILPEMKNLYGKSIMLYCFILLVAFTTLAASQFIKKFNNDTLCVSLGFIIMFSFLGAFTWLNIICFDMWMAFGSMRVINLYNKKKELRRFIFYNIYGWGVPTFFTGFAVLVYQYKFLPEILIPKIGKTKCFFSKEENPYDHILYFLLPMTLLIVCNCVLFVKTIAYYIKVKDEIYKMNDNTNDSEKRTRSFRNDRDKLHMLLKLFLIMGISWFFEMITSFVSFRNHTITIYFEYVWDIFNCLTGVFIFCIFILKRKVLVSLKKRFFHTIATRRTSEQSSTAVTSLHSQNRMREFASKRNNSVIINKK